MDGVPELVIGSRVWMSLSSGESHRGFCEKAGE
jgi:hypothetical protein